LIGNASSPANTITISFFKDDGSAVASTSSSVAAGATWILGSASGLSPPGATGAMDFEGTAAVSDTGGDSFYYSAVAFPASPGVGAPLALSGFPMTPVTVSAVN
jgi:isopropylmalate/homocitrate/citramalate synthase